MTEKILCVDDDANILNAYRRTLRKQFSIETVLGGAKGLAKISHNGPYAVVVSDMRMPEMNGIEFLEKVQEISPDTVRMMLTGFADINTAIEVVNRGNIFRFLTKPCDPKEFAVSLEAGLKQYRLVMAEKELLSKTLTGSVKTMIDILAVIDPESFGQSVALRASVQDLGELMRIRDSWEIEITAMLLHIGYTTLPPDLLLRMRRKEPLSETEKTVLRKVPEFGYNLLKNIPRLESVAKGILYQDKNFDGSGFPGDSVAGQDLPLTARLLKILKDFNGLRNSGKSTNRSLEIMTTRTGGYDPKVLERVKLAYGKPRPISTSRSPKRQTKEEPASRVFLKRLAPGNVLAADVRTKNGKLLVSSGTPLTGVIIEKLKNYADLKEIEGPVQVRG